MTMYDKIAQMKPEQKNHWIDVPELSYWGERFFAEFSVAEAVAKPEEMPLLEKAVDSLYERFCREHALTDDACRAAEEFLLPFADRAKAYTIHCVAHAHIDMDWMWGLHETVDVILSTMRTMLDLMDEYPAFTFSQSQCAVYRIIEAYDPALFRRVQEKVREGRLEFAGSAFVELDKNLPNLESMARHILYTKQYLHNRFGIPYEKVNLDFHPDTFGHSASVPEILRAGGIRYFYHCRGLDGTYFYRWRGESGAEILALNEPLWYNDQIRPMYLCQAPKFCDRYGIHDMMKIYGVGDHGGGPTRKDIESILDMMTWPVAPAIRFSSYAAYFAAVEPYRENFPVLTGELGPTFTGCYTSQSLTKLANRVGEDRLYMAEALTAFAVEKTKMEDFNRQFRYAWEKILFNQFHDILPGSNTPASRDHAMGSFEDALGSVSAAAGASLRAFADAIDTSMFETPFEPLTSRSEGAGAGLGTDQPHRFRLPSVERGRGKRRLFHVFNPTGFDREEVLELTVWDWPGDTERMQIFDVTGNLLPCSAATVNTNDWGHVRAEVLVMARVPAMSYTTLRVEEGEKTSFCFCALPPDPRVTRYTPLVLENDLVRVEFDEADLSVKRYVNKKTGKNLLGPQGGRFMLYRERAAIGDRLCASAWVEGVSMEPKDLHRAGKVLMTSLLEDQKLRQRFQYEIHYEGSVIQVQARLDWGSPILELDVSCRWMMVADNEGSPKLTFRTQLAWTPEVFRSDNQIGLQDRVPQPAHDWWGRDFSYAVGPDTGAAILTDSKYGYRGYENYLEVSLLRSSFRPDECPELGVRSFRLGFAGAPDHVQALKALGSRFAQRDLPYASNRAHKGTLPLAAKLLEVSGGAVVHTVKVPEDGKGLIVRLSNPMEESISCTVAAPGLAEARTTDLAEQDLSVLPVSGGAVSLALPSKGVGTLRLLLTQGRE